MRATEAGVILGTASYMAPEQAAGKSVDKRADIWSFGVVLWEMLTGRRLFDGETVSHTLADVLRAPIDLDAIPAATPRAVRELVRRCLERDERKRLRDIGEARILLENPVAEAAPMTVTTRRGLPYWAAVAVCLLPAAVMGVLKWREQPPAAPVVRFTIDAPEKGFAFTAAGASRISPDGTKLLILDRRAGVGLGGSLWIRRLDSTQLQPLAGTDDATYPFWSGDSRHVGFFADGKLKRISMEGGPPMTICAAPDGRSGAWHGGADGVIVFAPSNNGPLSMVSAGGGELRVATALDEARKEAFHRLPHFLPDGKRFLYLAGAPGDLAVKAVYAGELPADGGKPAIGKLVVKNQTEAMLASSGHLLFVRENTLLAQPFDTAKLAFTGEPVPVAENVGTGGIRHNAAFSISTTGILTYRHGAGAGELRGLVWLDRQGKETGRVPARVDFSGMIRLSPDSKFLVGSKAEASGGGGDLWMADFERGSLSRFTFDARTESNPVWSPDGQRIAYRAGFRGAGSPEILVKHVGRVGEPVSLLKTAAAATPSGWSRDGKWLFYSEFVEANKSAVFAIAVDGDRKPIRLVPPQFNSTYPTPSPDGRYFAYTSNESGQNEVFVRTFSPDSPNEARKWQISNGNSGTPVPQWSADGKEIFYVDGNRRMIAVPVQASGAGFQVGKPVVLFEAKGLTIPSADGQRFLSFLPEGEAEKPVENIVLNWTALLGGRR